MLLDWSARRLTLEHKHARPSRKTRKLASLHQTPYQRIALLFAYRACDSKVSLVAGYFEPISRLADCEQRAQNAA